MTLEALKSGRITHASQDGSREFISLLACICADGSTLPPALIYQGESGTLQDSWIEDWTPQDQAHFAVSTNGWSCDALGLDWLENVFDRYTKQKAGNRRRLLLVDGHSSHVNMKFINLCDSLRILLMILPPHSTHRLQPLDVSLFAPLARYYTNGLNELMFNSLGMVSMSKRAFWSVFLPAWKQAFSTKNVASGFAKTGIWPLDSSVVLDVIRKPTPIEASDALTTLKTPMTSKAVRRLHRIYRNAPDSPILAKILWANSRLAAQHSIDQHMMNGLIDALKNEKKRRKRGKRLNLLGEEDSGPQFFSPARVQAARDLQTTKEEQEAQRRQDILDKKAEAATKRQLKEEEKKHRAAVAAAKRELAAEAKAVKTAEKQAQRELKEVVNGHNQGQQRLQGQSTGTSKPQKTQKKQIRAPGSTAVAHKAEEVILLTAKGRRVQRPQRFST